MEPLLTNEKTNDSTVIAYHLNNIYYGHVIDIINIYYGHVIDITYILWTYIDMFTYITDML